MLSLAIIELLAVYREHAKHRSQLSQYNSAILTIYDMHVAMPIKLFSACSLTSSLHVLQRYRQNAAALTPAQISLKSNGTFKAAQGLQQPYLCEYIGREKCAPHPH